MIPAPAGAYVIRVEERRQDGSSYRSEFDVVAFDDAGTPLVIDDRGQYNVGLVTPGDLVGGGKWVLEPKPRHATTPAEPGWYALYTMRLDEGDELERLPVIAWRVTPDEYGGSATIIGVDDCDAVMPQDAVAYARDCSNVELLGFFHPERYPEPPRSPVIA